MSIMFWDSIEFFNHSNLTLEARISNSLENTGYSSARISNPRANARLF